MNLNDLHKIYFIGVGGIGMSALARYFNGLGMEVHGYDKTSTSLTKKLVDEGINIHYEDDLKYIPEGIDLVIYTPAIPKDHGELNYFLTHDYPVKKRSEVLGIISRNRRAIGIAGTHGKTTTSSILTHVLRTGGVDCTAFLGGIAQNYGSNFVAGESNWVVVEADEYDRSFLQLTPEYAAIISMDPDHLDIYGSPDFMHEGFTQYAEKVKANGTVFLREGLQLKRDGVALQTFGVEAGTYCARDIRVEDGCFVFDFDSPIERIENIQFALAGRHNVENATAAIAIAQQLSVDGNSIKRALASFKGIKRRFEIIYRDHQKVYIDDYAHHPTELSAAIEAARTLFPGRKLTGIFQPHLYSRTRDFVSGFAAALDGLDEVVLLDIYPAREEPIDGVTSELIFERMQLANKKMLTKAALMDSLVAMDIDVLLTLGAGDIDVFVEPIKNYLSNA